MTPDSSKREDALFNAFKGIFKPNPMTLEEKIQEISLDAKQAEQIKVLFECGFAIGIAFHQVTGLDPSKAVYDTMKKTYLEMIPEEICKTFDAIMKEYEKQQPIKDGD